jgi:hypothetical protein
MLANSSSDKEESDGEWTTSNRWEFSPTSPRVVGASVESTLKAGTGPPVTGSSVEVPVGTAEAPVGVVEAPQAFEENEEGFL